MSSLENKLRWCTTCLAMSTRNRITFDENGSCNACQWKNKKSSMNWEKRSNELNTLLDRHRSIEGNFDCLVPCSGGKDGSYVAYNLKHQYNMNPLCLTVTPPLSLSLGDENLKSFINSSYNHISINPHFESMRQINRAGFEKIGFPYFGWLTAIQSAPVRMASKLGIGLIFYGEDGEVEYGGTDETLDKPIYDVEYMKKIYLEDGYDTVLNSINLDQKDIFFFKFPELNELKNNSIEITHWSYFENWDPYRNYLIAKEHCGLREQIDPNVGTFTNFSQNDQALYALHAYIMYLKFGFGRATQDASIEVRRGAMDRDQAINLVKIYDGQYPSEFKKTYLDYYKMTEHEFDLIIDKWANKDLFIKENGYWKPKFEIV